MGFLVGLTTIMAMVVTGMVVVVLHNISYGPIIAVVTGCSTSGILFMLILWSYQQDYGEPPKKKKKKEEKTDAD